MRLGAYVLTGGGLIAGALLAAPGAAWATWSAESDGSSATVRAAELPAVEAPRAAPGKRKSSVVVRWPEASVVRGVPVETYRVARIDTLTGDRVDVSGSCRGLITGIRCTDVGLPDGRWTYRVRAVLGDWTGSWSPVSATVVVDTTPVEKPEPQKLQKPQKTEPKPETPVPAKPAKPAPAPEVPAPAAPEAPAEPESPEPEAPEPEAPEPEAAGPEDTAEPEPSAGPAETTAIRPDQD